MAEDNKKSIDELQTSADSLLARLNVSLGGEAAKADGAEGNPAGASKVNAGENAPDDKFNALYEKYLGESPSQNGAGGDFEAWHGRIGDVQKESGGETPKIPDVDESIKQAETFSETLPENSSETGKSASEDDEYWAMMKTVHITSPKKDDTKQNTAAPTADTAEVYPDILRKNI